MPTLQTLVDWANFGVVVTLALSFLFGGASIFLSRRLGEQKDAQYVREKQLSDTNIAGLQIAVAKAEKERAEAQRIVLEIQERVSDRHLTAGQRERLLEILKRDPPGTFNLETMASNPETYAFGNELADVLKEAGWTLRESKPILNNHYKGLWLILSKQDSDTQFAASLQSALSEIGWSTEYGTQGDKPKNSGLTLFVATKP